MAKTIAKTIACCPACRLVHPSPGRPCRCCGAAQSTAALDALVVLQQRWRLRRRSPGKRGWRWFDIAFVGVLIVGPLEAERRDPDWTTFVLLVVAASWLLLRLVLYLATRFRWVKQETAARISDVALLPGASGTASSARVEGVARRLRDSTDAHLIERRCLASSLLLEPEASPGRVRLRRVRMVPFAIECADGLRYRVEGEVMLCGASAHEVPAASAVAHFGGQALGQSWLAAANVREVLLQNRQVVRIKGGERRDEAGAPAHAGPLIVGVAGNPVFVQIGRAA